MFQLTENDIHLAAYAENKQQAIELVATSLIESGCVESGYLQGMLEREAQLTTYLGKGIAIPHGTIATRSMVKKTGVKVFQFPQGVPWTDHHTVYVVIGIAANSDAHLTLLRQLTHLLDSEISTPQLANTQDPAQFRAMLLGEMPNTLITAHTTRLAVETESLLTLTALNADNLQQQEAIDEQFIHEVISSAALPLGRGIWLTDATVGNRKNAIAFSRAKTPFRHNSKMVHAVLTISTIDEQINDTLASLLDEQVQQTLLTGDIEQILSIFKPEQGHNPIPNATVLVGQVPAVEAIVTVRNAHGLHYRPAATLVNYLKQYHASVAVQNLDNGGPLISAKSLIKVTSLGAQKGHRLHFVATGQDAKQAIKGICDLIESDLAEEK